MSGTSESPHNYIILVSNQSDVVMGCIDIQLNSTGYRWGLDGVFGHYHDSITGC